MLSPSKSPTHTPRAARRRARTIGAGLLGLAILGCGSTSTKSKIPVQVAPSPQVYFAPFVSGTSAVGTPQIYTIDDTGTTASPPAFSQTTYQVFNGQQGSQVINAGTVSIGARSLRNLAITVNYSLGGVPTQYLPQVYDPPVQGSFAVELAGQAGGLVQLVGQPATPLVAATQCPKLAKPQSYQFLTIPAPLAQPSSAGAKSTWDPTSETAYGSVDISASGSNVKLDNIQQRTLPVAGIAGPPTLPAAPSLTATGTCAPTIFGSITNVPGQLIITAPGSGEAVPPQASIGIGPSGLLVEDNGITGAIFNGATPPPIYYDSVLGAGTGAIGLPKPSAALDSGALVGAQYLGFIYAAGTYTPTTSGTPAFSSYLASFGVSGAPANCGNLTPTTSTPLLYGGDYDAASAAGGPGNSNFVIDLGAEDTTNAGLFSTAMVTVCPTYPGNTVGITDQFSAVAIAGQLGGKFAIFVLGSDTIQPWMVYLLQSN